MDTLLTIAAVAAGLLGLAVWVAVSAILSAEHKDGRHTRAGLLSLTNES